jgi:hypothetical protein
MGGDNWDASREATDHRDPGRRAAWYLDAAVFLGLLSAIIYALGWVRWATFYGGFGIGATLIDLPPEKVIATTWPVPVIAVSCAILGSTLTAVRIPPKAKSAALTILCIAAIGLFQLVHSPWAYLVTIGVVTAWGTVVLGPDCVRRSADDPSRRFVALAVGLLVLGCLILLSEASGERAAQKLKAGRGWSIRVHVTAREQPPEGVLIGHMSGRYFVWARPAPDRQARTYIIPDSAVLSAEAIPPSH